MRKAPEDHAEAQPDMRRHLLLELFPLETWLCISAGVSALAIISASCPKDMVIYFQGLYPFFGFGQILLCVEEELSLTAFLFSEQ